jgi:hypothetical protein
MRFIVQLDDGNDLAASGADDVIDALLRDPKSVSVRFSLVPACRFQQGRHGDLGKYVMVGKRHDEPAEELLLVIGHQFAPPVRASSACSFRSLQMKGDEARRQYDQDEEDEDKFHVCELI